MSKGKDLAKFIAGVGIGAGLGILLAPKSGKETREDLKKKLDNFIKEVKEIDINEVKNEFLKKIDELKEELSDLDKEKILNIAKDKGDALKEKATELVELAKEKGTPVLENAAKEVRQKAIAVTKDILAKLEKNA